jgi:hypothetical protein
MCATQCGIAALVTSKAAVMAMRMNADRCRILSGLGAFYDCAALLAGNGHWRDIAIRSILLSS